VGTERDLGHLVKIHREALAEEQVVVQTTLVLEQVVKVILAVTAVQVPQPEAAAVKVLLEVLLDQALVAQVAQEQRGIFTL
jgi:hypothetical protein